jgi:hypothetical protein
MTGTVSVQYPLLIPIEAILLGWFFLGFFAGSSHNLRSTKKATSSLESGLLS